MRGTTVRMTDDGAVRVTDDDTRVLLLPGVLLGIGLGGFVDGIVLHQILQWHHLVSNVPAYPPTTVGGLRVNTLWDGLFHAFTWTAVAVGLAVLWSRVTRDRGRLWRSAPLWGWFLVGWGGFNLVEGIVDHQILRIHHVRPGPNQLAWDLGFLALGAVLALAGWRLARAGRASRP